MVRLGEAKAVAEILNTSLDRLTWRTGEARVIEELAALTRQAKDAFRLISENTAELLRARGVLRNHPAVIGDDLPGAARIRNAVMEAREVQELTPEGAVAQGIAQRVRATEFYEWAGADLPVIRPGSIADAAQIADALRTGEVVVIDLARAPAPDVERILDFVNGATRVRGGTVSPVGDTRYRVSPAVVNDQVKAITSPLRRLADTGIVMRPYGSGA
jgi:FtsZ-interacting cell division protein YlmF